MKYKSKLPYQKVTLKKLETWLKALDASAPEWTYNHGRIVFEYILEECKLDNDLIDYSLNSWVKKK